MKKIVSIIAVLAMVLSFSACDLFNDDSVVKLGESYTHKDPDGLTYDERTVLKGEGFEETLYENSSMMAYPDTMYYDEEGAVIGMYMYDPETGIASGWTSFEDNSTEMFPEGEEIDLGLPDESLIAETVGGVTMYYVVYGNKDEAAGAYMYLMLEKAEDKDTVKTAMQNIYGVDVASESDTVLTLTEDKDAIVSSLEAMESEDKSAAAYVDILKLTYGLKNDGINPYKPYEGHEDPEDLDFDKKAVLTGRGEYAVYEENVDDLKSMTCFVYGFEGKACAEYTYYECASKESADALMAAGNVLEGGERVSDTVVRMVYRDQTLEDMKQTYMGYNVLPEDTFDAYASMVEGNYMVEIYE